MLLIIFTAAILLQVLTLVEDEVILLEERFAAFGTDVRPQRAASLRVALVMQHESVFRHETFPTELAEMCFRFLLRRRRDLHDCLLLLLLHRLLLCNLHCLLLHHLLLNLRSLLRLLRLLLVNLNLLVLLAVRRTLKDLIHDLAARSDDLHWHWRRRCARRCHECRALRQVDLIDALEQMSRNGGGERAQIVDETLVPRVKT